MTTVLVVDDRQENREFLVTLLGYRNYRVLEAADGLEALAIARKERPNLVIADILMPNMDGYELVRRLREEPSLAEMAVIFNTAHFLGREAMALARKLGIEHVLAKPSEPEVVYQVVDRALGHPSTPQPSISDAELDRNHLLVLARNLRDQADALRIANARFEEVVALAFRLGGEMNFDRVIASACEAARRLVGARFAFAAVEGDVTLEASHAPAIAGMPAEQLAGIGPFRFREGKLAALYDGKASLRLVGCKRDIQSVGLPAGFPPVENLLAVPVRIGAHIGGYLCLADKLGLDEFDETDAEVAAGVAAMTGRALHAIALTADLRRQMQELEREIASRQATEAALRRSQRLEVVGQLTGGMAHDFNNLLTIILSNLELSHDRVEGAHPARPFIDTAIEACLQGAQLNRSLLAFARQQDLTPTRLDVAALLDRLARMFRHTLGEQIEVSVKVADGLWPVYVDASQLESALLNLAVNARDAMPEGGRLILEAGNATLDEAYCAANPGVVPGDYCSIAVSDNGTGMTPETLVCALEPFFTTKEVGKGSGMGLSMVFGFVKQSEGDLKILSETGRGTTVQLYLPRDRSSHAAAAIATDDVTPRASSGERKTILVVEDNEQIRLVALLLLDELGYNAVPAQDAQSALHMLEAGLRPDLLFTDLVMPGPLNGEQLAREAVRRRPELRVLLTSGFADRGVQNSTTEPSPWTCLGKPYRKKQLASAVAQAIGGAAVAAA